MNRDRRLHAPVPCVDYTAPLRFLRTAYELDDWIAVFLKSHDTGRTAQRVGPVMLFQQPSVQAWFRLMNARRFSVYVTVNAVSPGRRNRTRDAIHAIRHVFLDVDRDGCAVLTTINARRDLPPPSYVIWSSPNRLHVLWRARDFTTSDAEHLQKHLARELGADPAATACSQMTRLPGFLNHKYAPPALVRATYALTTRAWAPTDFPMAPIAMARLTREPRRPRQTARPDVTNRARRYLAALPAAVAGQHGDLATFRACCRLVRGFLLSDADALDLIREWNTRCQPPWTDRELAEKVRRARHYGREPLGGLLNAPYQNLRRVVE